MKNRVYTRGLAVILSLWFFFSVAQKAFALPFGKSEKEFYAFDFLSFKSAEDEKTLLEIFCQIPTDNLIFIRFKDGFFASYRLTISLYDISGNEVAKQSLTDSVTVNTFKDIDRPRTPKLIRFSLLLEPGEYQAQMKLKDLETLKSLDFRKKILVQDYNAPGLQLSDLQIAASISARNGKDVLVKNNWKVIPNVTRVVSIKQNVLYIYAELYNLLYSSVKPNKEFIVSYMIQDKEGQEIKSLKRKKSKKSGNSFALVASIPVPELKTGQYRLILYVEDLDNAQKIQKSTSFYVI